jgi:peroxiredoxin
MKKLKKQAVLYVFLLISIVFNSYCNAGSGNPGLAGGEKGSNPGLSIGESIPNPQISPIFKYEGEKIAGIDRLYEYKQDKVLLIAFMPSLTENYADVMTKAFDTYFAEGLSFRSFEQYAYANPELQVIVVTPDDQNTIQQYMTTKDMNFMMLSDKEMNISNLFGISKWETDKTGNSSYVYIVDKDNKITYANYDYKGEGEKLKSVQGKLFSMFDLKEDLTSSNSNYTSLLPGEKERDFNFKYITINGNNGATPDTKDGALSDYIGKKNVLIAFYPAAYSYSCSAEITKFDHFAEDRLLEKVKNNELKNDDLEILMVSVSNPYILAKWKDDINLNNVKLVSDNDGSISAKYNSFSQLGYNKRTVFLVDKEGNVSYINWDYHVDDNDFGILKDNIASLK